MKLRISGNSVRLRLLRSDMTTLLETGHLEHTVHLGPEADCSLEYGLAHEVDLTDVVVRSRRLGLTVVLPTRLVQTWADTEQIGIYATIDLGSRGSLDVLVEKDFACLDLSDSENRDTFPNPQTGVLC